MDSEGGVTQAQIKPSHGLKSKINGESSLKVHFSLGPGLICVW